MKKRLTLVIMLPVAIILLLLLGVISIVFCIPILIYWIITGKLLPKIVFEWIGKDVFSDELFKEL